VFAPDLAIVIDVSMSTLDFTRQKKPAPRLAARSSVNVIDAVAVKIFPMSPATIV
jgi:hypothetical protein